MIIQNTSNVEFTFVLPDGSSQTENRDSNIVETEVLTYSFTKVKSSNKAFLQEGESAEQTVVLTNNSQFNISNQIFKDIMSVGASYNIGSVFIDGISYPAHDLIAGFPINDLAPGASTTIKYTITANNPQTNEFVVNYANLAYTAGETNFAENTNEITIPLVNGRMDIVKQVDKAVAVRGDILHYTSTIINSGTFPKTNIVFRDNIPVETTFVVGSVRVAGVSQPTYDPEAGFALPDMQVGDSVIVEFDVRVN